MAIETFERLLGEHPFFKDLEASHLATIVGCASNVKFEAGEFIFRERQPAERFYVIRHGQVAVETFLPGRGAITIETMRDGEVLGWSWLFAPFKWHFDARAVTLVRALALDGTCLRGKCEKDAAFGYEIMKRFAEVAIRRMEATQLQLLDLYGNQP
ncbi:MAG TPA: cyclic nucleotide-binding domain-containing protein [Vicinamibacteria bacterium]|nr:cyclic nucleotide-binding domain-containing protein [Vicinamibacteria bacterium]